MLGKGAANILICSAPCAENCLDCQNQNTLAHPTTTALKSAWESPIGVAAVADIRGPQSTGHVPCAGALLRPIIKGLNIARGVVAK